MIRTTPRFESRSLLDAAAGQPCVLCELEGRLETETTVAAHLPSSLYSMPAGMGGKTHDWLAAHCCHEHHAEIDGALGRRNVLMRMQALCLTLERLFDSGVLQVAAPKSTV